MLTYKQRGKFLSKYDFRPLTKGASKELPINSQTIKAISDEYVTRRKKFKKIKRKWRGRKSLGWIPFNGQTVKIIDDVATYDGIKIRFWKRRELLGNIKTGSDGIKYDRENLTKKYEVRLAKYQRAHKKKQVKNLHAKIKNKRKDFSHKVSNEICSTSEIVIVGDVSASKLAKTRMAKSVLDAGWSQLTTMLHYKAIRHGMVVKKVSEK